MSLFKKTETDIARAYDAYADMLYRLALTHLQNTQDAQDAVQDVFMKYMTAGQSFRGQEHERAWLIRTMVNCCHDLFRRRKIRSHVPLEEIAELIPDDGPAGAVDNAFSVMRLLGAVGEKNRSVLTLHYLEGFSVEEIAGMLGISLSAVKMRLARGRDSIKGVLEQEGS